MRHDDGMGLNLNSIVVQQMLKNTPSGVGNWLVEQGTYGPSPRVETVIEPSLSGQQIPSGGGTVIQPTPFPSPYQMLSGVGMQNYQLPSYQFSGALSGQTPSVPSYFDASQPIQQPYQGLGGMPIGYGSMLPSYANGYYPPGSGMYYPPNAGMPPRYMYGAAPGTLYSNVEGQMYPGIQENPYSPLPSMFAVMQAQQPAQYQVPISGYYNPYMGQGQGIMLPQQQVQNIYQMARHNYALQFGFRSVKEMEENDMEIMKTISAIANRTCGFSDDQIKERIESVYGPKTPEQPMTFENRFNVPKKPAMHVQVLRGEEVIFDSQKTGVTIKGGSALMANISYMLDRSAIYRFNRDIFNQQMHAAAIERRFDKETVVGFFNNAFYEIHMRDMALLQKKQRDQRIGKLYDKENFKREIMARFGRPATIARLQTEDMRFHKSDPTEDGIVKGGYGYLPGGVPMDNGSDPRLGYCFGLNLVTNQLELKPPRRDDELAMIKNKFLASIGQHVPIYAGEQALLGMRPQGM